MLKPARRLKIVLLIIFSLIMLRDTFPQADLSNETIAEVNGDKITPSLFRELWEMSPHLYANNKYNTLSEKINFLYTIIAYKLWYQNKTKYGIDTSDAYSTAVEELQKMFVRDALYKREILDKIHITKDELESALNKQKRTLLVNYILAKGEEEIKNLYQLLESGLPFDSLLSVRDEFKKQTEPIKIKFGDYSATVEEELFNLKPNSFSRPIKFNDGYYIFFLKNELRNIWENSEGQKKDVQAAEDVIKKRNEDILYDKFMRNILKDKKAEVNKDLHNKLKNRLVDFFAKKRMPEKNNSFITLNIDEFIDLENEFSKAELESEFISLDGRKIILDKYLRALYFNGLKIPSNDKSVIAQTFETYLKDFIEKEILYAAGIKENLQFDSEVRKYMEMWSEYYAFETIRGGMIDTSNVSEKAIKIAYKDLYKDAPENTFFKFDYLGFQNLNLANAALERIKRGKNYDSLKSRNTHEIKNAFFSDKDKWVPLSDCGKCKNEILGKNNEDYLTPFKYDSLYVLLKIIDKKKSEELLGYQSYEEVYPKLRNQLAWEKLKNNITHKTAEFASSSNIKIDYEALKKIELTRISAVTVRYMGFGGSISGVPVYIPNYDWVELLDSKKLVP